MPTELLALAGDAVNPKTCALQPPGACFLPVKGNKDSNSTGPIPELDLLSVWHPKAGMKYVNLLLVSTALFTLASK